MRCVLLILAGVGSGVDGSSHWWADQPVVRPQTPEVANAGWCTNEIDAFLLARLEAQGITPAPQADRRALIRRATYDLTGLPPTPQEVEAFVQDTRPDAWSRLIERLLASDQYGVRWGRHWLDLVRWAETDGYERDRVKPGAWRYRDWVINAFNDDMPYDEFIVHQLAGDELPDADFDSMIATGFLHLGIRDDEPTDPPLAIYDDLDGMLDTTCRATLGISMGCVRCHDHKGDAIPQRDYYRMLACFQDLKPYRSGFGNAVRQDNFVRHLPTDFGREDPGTLKHWLAQRDGLLHEARTLARSAIGGADITESFAPSTSGQVVHLDFEDDPELCEAGVQGHALLVGSAENAVEIPRPVSDDFSITLAFRPDADGAGDDANPRWFLGSGLVDGEISGVVDDFGLSWCKGSRVCAGVGRPETFIHGPGGLETGAWHWATLTRARQTGEIDLWIDGEHVAHGVGGTQPLTSPDTLHVGIMHTGANPFPGAIDDVRIHNRVLTPGEILSLHESPAWSDQATRRIGETLGSDAAVRHDTLRARRLDMTRPRPETVPALVAVCVEGAPMDTWVLERGTPGARGEQVRPGVPEILGGEDLQVLPSESGQGSGRRTALAEWITQESNPRTARVLANRLWQHHFGRGIVPTPDDFGAFGLEPTHPELLDWLAVEVVSRNWSRKDLHRLIMHSSAYRMASDQSLDQADPTNALWYRFPMRRLSAEEVRDSMLAVSGRLNLQLGGESVYPPMPDDVLATASRPDAAWGRSTPDQANRRSAYIHVKRSLLPPLLHAFDLADTDAACPVRFTTMPPTQSLIMLNSDETTRYAADLGDRLRAVPGDTADRLATGLGLVTQRPAQQEDIDDLRELLVAFTESGMDEDTAWTYTCLAMLNLNAFVYVD